MTRSKFTFDASKPYGTVRALRKEGKNAKYMQGGRLFSPTGEYIGEAPGCGEEVEKAPAIPTAETLSAGDKRRQALIDAADRLGDFTIPSDMQDAARENAEALAAEGNA